MDKTRVSFRHRLIERRDYDETPEPQGCSSHRSVGRGEAVLVPLPDLLDQPMGAEPLEEPGG